MTNMLKIGLARYVIKNICNKFNESLPTTCTLLEEFSKKWCLAVGSSTLLKWQLNLPDHCPFVGRTHILLARDMPTAHNRFQCNVHLIGRSDYFVANDQKEPIKDAHLFYVRFCYRSKHGYQSKLSRSTLLVQASTCNQHAPIHPETRTCSESFPRPCNQKQMTKSHLRQVSATRKYMR